MCEMRVLTMMVKAAPLFATILCRWLGRFAMPIGDADSIAAGAMVLAWADIRSVSTLTGRDRGEVV